MKSDILPGQPELIGQRLVLRPLRRSDVGLLELYASDARIARMTATIPHPYPPGMAEAFFKRLCQPKAVERVWAMDTDPESENGFVGLISLKPAGEGGAEIGYWVAPAFWGTGYASEAVELVVDYAAARGLSPLTAQVFQENAPAARVLTRAGFAYVGEGELHCVARAGMVPTFCYRRVVSPVQAVAS